MTRAEFEKKHPGKLLRVISMGAFHAAVVDVGEFGTVVAPPADCEPEEALDYASQFLLARKPKLTVVK